MKIRVVKPRIWDFEILTEENALQDYSMNQQEGTDNAFADSEWRNVGKAGIIAGVPKDIPLDESVMRMFDNNYMASLRFIVARHKLQMTKGNDPEHLRNKIGKELTGRSTRYVDPKQNLDGDMGEYTDIIVPWHILKLLRKYRIRIEEYQKDIDRGERNSKPIRKIREIPHEQIYDKMALIEFSDATRNSIVAYNELLKSEIPRESARYVLPFNIAEAQYTVQVSLDYIKNFVGQRTCVRASPEMRCLGSQYYFETIKAFPQLRGHLGCNGIMRGVCPESNVTGYRTGKPNERTCPFRLFEGESRARLTYIPTQDELKHGNFATYDWEKIIKVYEKKCKRFADWRG